MAQPLLPAVTGTFRGSLPPLPGSAKSNTANQTTNNKVVKSAAPTLSKEIQNNSPQPASNTIQPTSPEFDINSVDPQIPASLIGTLLIPSIYIRIGEVVLHNTFPPTVSGTPIITGNVQSWNLQMDTGKNPAVPVVGDPNSYSTGQNTFRITLNPWLVDNIGQPLLPSLSGSNYCVLIIGYPNTQLSRRHIFRQKSLSTQYGNDQNSEIEYYGQEWGLGRFSNLIIYQGNNRWQEGVVSIFKQTCQISGIPESKCNISFIPERVDPNTEIPLNIGPVKFAGGHSEQLNTIIKGVAGCRPIWRNAGDDGVELVVNCDEWRKAARKLAAESPLLYGGTYKTADNAMWLGRGLLETVTIEGSIADQATTTPFTGEFCQNINQSSDSTNNTNVPLSNQSACGYKYSPDKGLKSAYKNVFAVELTKEGKSFDVPIPSPFNGVIVENSIFSLGGCTENQFKSKCERKPGEAAAELGNFIAIQCTDKGPLLNQVWTFTFLGRVDSTKLKAKDKVVAGQKIGVQSNSGAPTSAVLGIIIGQYTVPGDRTSIKPIADDQAELLVKQYLEAITRECPKDGTGKPADTTKPDPGIKSSTPPKNRPLNLPAPKFGTYAGISNEEAKIINEWAKPRGYNAADIGAFIEAESNWDKNADNRQGCVGLWQCCVRVNPWCADIKGQTVLYQLNKLDEYFERKKCKKQILESEYQFGPMYQCIGLEDCPHLPGNTKLDSILSGVCDPDRNGPTWCAPNNPYRGTCDGITWYGENRRIADKRLNDSASGERLPGVSGLTNCVTQSKTRAIHVINSGDNVAGGFAYVRWTEEVQLKAEFGVCPRNIFLAPLSPDGRSHYYILLAGADNEQGYIDFFIDQLTINWDGTMRIAVSGRRGPLLEQFEKPITLPMPQTYYEWINYYWNPDVDREARAFVANGTVPVLQDTVLKNAKQINSDLNNAAQNNAPPNDGTKVDPLKGKGVISSPFGWRSSGFHHGIDISLGTGNEVVAWANGVVDWTQYGHPLAGNFVIINHGAIDGGETIYTRYLHLNTIANIKQGDKIFAGQRIGEVGSTGRSTGPHLHFETNFNSPTSNSKDPCKTWPPLCSKRARV